MLNSILTTCFNWLLQVLIESVTSFWSLNRITFFAHSFNDFHWRLFAGLSLSTRNMIFCWLFNTFKQIRLTQIVNARAKSIDTWVIQGTPPLLPITGIHTDHTESRIPLPTIISTSNKSSLRTQNLLGALNVDSCLDRPGRHTHTQVFPSPSTSQANRSCPLAADAPGGWNNASRLPGSQSEDLDDEIVVFSLDFSLSKLLLVIVFGSQVLKFLWLRLRVVHAALNCK